MVLLGEVSVVVLGRKEAVEHRPIVTERHLWVALWTDPDRHFAAAKSVSADLDNRFVAVV